MDTRKISIIVLSFMAVALVIAAIAISIQLTTPQTSVTPSPTPTPTITLTPTPTVLPTITFTPTPTFIANENPLPSTVLHACGQHCNQATGLCQAGYTCAFDNAVCQTNGIYNNTTYCVPNSVYVGLPRCASQYNNTDKYIVNSGGAVTESYIQSLCVAAPTTNPSNPTPTFASGTLPDTAVISEQLDPIFFGLILVVFGVSLYPRIRFKNSKK